MSQQSTTQIPEPTLTDLVDHLTRFEGPPDQFLLQLLAVQCHIGSAESGAILRTQNEDEPEILAVYPAPADNQTAPVWLARSVEILPRVTSSKNTEITPLRGSDELYEQEPRQHLIMIPLRSDEGVRGVAAFVVAITDLTAVEHRRQRLELTMSLLSLYEMRLTLQQRQVDLQRLRQAFEVLASVNDHKRFKAAGMAFCNEVSSTWKSDRVTLGFLKGRYVRAAAMSHTEKFTRKMKLVLDIESAMEECFDQDLEVLHPPTADASYVSRAATDLASRHGPNTVCSVPLRQDQKVTGVLTVERAVDKPFSMEELELLRLVCELSTARLEDLFEHDKWIGAKAAGGLRKFAATLYGHEHTWLKVLLSAIFVVLVFFVFAKGNDYADGKFVIEPVERRVMPAPYPGFLEKVLVEPGDHVEAGQLLATFNTRELREQKRRALAERAGYLVQARSFHANPAQKQVAESQADAVQAQIKQIDQQLEKTEIKTPIAGIVTQGDWKDERGRPFERTDILFEVAPIKRRSLRAELSIPENRIDDVAKLDFARMKLLADRNAIIARAEEEDRSTTDEEREKIDAFKAEAEDLVLRGDLAPKSHPGTYLPLTVTRINPIADVVDQKNVYRVRVEIRLEDKQWDDVLTWLKPGHEGIGRIKVGRDRYAWLWTRDLINWVRMKLWK